jgi:hypothetical protein
VVVVASDGSTAVDPDGEAADDDPTATGSRRGGLVSSPRVPLERATVSPGSGGTGKPSANGST